MRCDEHVLPAALAPRSEPEYSAYYTATQYASSLCSTSSQTTSASISSGWSDAVSQKSDASSATSVDSDSCDSYRRSLRRVQTFDFSSTTEAHLKFDYRSAAQQQQTTTLRPEIPIPAELRQNPRRSTSCSTARSGCPPSLVRQADRKVNFVDNLVDSSTQIVEAIWPTSSVICRSEASNSVLPLRTFIQETLRRSRTSFSTLQVALYYLILIKAHVPAHDFTMEQPEDCHASRALQCGRRMFLAALILASKYLQDRNYSARAWSKISGLATQEINQNEMAFLLAVNWKLHITNEVYNRWTDCVMKFTPSQPPSPGGAAQRLFDKQCEDFRNIVLKLTPELDNLDDLAPPSQPATASLELSSSPPRSLYSTSPSDRPCGFGGDSPEFLLPTPKSYTPMVMEPAPATVYTPGRLAPALGLLPTPRLTPQSSAYSTPAANAASHLLRGAPSMSLAMAQASCAGSTTYAPWAAPMTSSPQSYFTARRSSLANTISTASSPESMISDSSRTSRSSSISSASSLASAPSTKLDVQARCRYAKQCSERLSMRPTIASVPEDYEENCDRSSSPEPYSGPVGKDLCAMSMETPLARKAGEMDDDAAARALQELHNYQAAPPMHLPAPVPRTGSKRSRPQSIDISLQDNVRGLLGRPELSRSQPETKPTFSRQNGWTGSLVRPRLAPMTSEPLLRGSVIRSDSRKRVCCSTEAAQQFPISSLHPAVGGIGGPGMWEGILN
ncbi:hypothetical protein RB601_000822 [Gaeumannomyces tritici]